MIEAFEQPSGFLTGYLEAKFRAFIYHVPMPSDAPPMNYPDMGKTVFNYDYPKLLTHAVQQVNRYGGQALLIDEKFYPFNPLQPMYERCRAMCAYVHSTAFNAPTLFLDGDAFLNADPMPVLATIKDVGVTYRNWNGLMPLNEGVIMAKPTDATRAFFRAYLATYEHLAETAEVKEHYGDVKRWRGGQLSLNAIASLGDVHDEMDCNTVAGADIRYLPCSTFNYAIEVDRDVPGAELDQKLVLHLKGPRKRLVDQVVQYQGGKI